MIEPRDDNGYRVTVDMLKLMLDADSPSPDRLENFEQFGIYGYAIKITERHIFYLQQINLNAVPLSRAFDPEMLHRWKTVNELLINSYRPESSISERLKSEFPWLAAMAAFPLLEEVARRISKAWDEDGNLLIDVPATFCLYRINSKGVRESKIFKAGQRIVDLSHKLVIMKSTLSEKFQASINSLDKRMNVSRFPGIEVEPKTFFERIEYLRNMWLHGRRLIGIEAWLVTFFLGLLYFRIPQDAEDIQLAEDWAKLAAQARATADKATDDNSASR